jgi:hypothetical protein
MTSRIHVAPMMRGAIKLEPIREVNIMMIAIAITMYMIDVLQVMGLQVSIALDDLWGVIEYEALIGLMS